VTIFSLNLVCSSRLSDIQLDSIIYLLQQTSNIHPLRSDWIERICADSVFILKTCDAIPSSVNQSTLRHLNIPVDNVDHVKTISDFVIEDKSSRRLEVVIELRVNVCQVLVNDRVNELQFSTAHAREEDEEICSTAIAHLDRSRLKHLDIPVCSIDQMKMVLQRLTDLISIRLSLSLIAESIIASRNH
jgi:hypothetical protein